MGARGRGVGNGGVEPPRIRSISWLGFSRRRAPRRIGVDPRDGAPSARSADWGGFLAALAGDAVPEGFLDGPDRDQGRQNRDPLPDGGNESVGSKRRPFRPFGRVVYDDGHLRGEPPTWSSRVRFADRPGYQETTMTIMQTIAVEIDAAGTVHPLDPIGRLPAGRALLTLLPGADDALALAEPALAEDWLRPEEDAAWAHLQPAK